MIGIVFIPDVAVEIVSSHYMQHVSIHSIRNVKLLLGYL